MGTNARIRVEPAADRLLDRAVARLTDLENRWSRFLIDSELSIVNRSNGRPTIVSADTIDLIKHAAAANELTGGLFDATLLGDLEALGYTLSHESLDADSSELGSDQRCPAPRAPRRSASIEIDEVLQTVTLAPNLGLDPGGIGKGLAADLVAGELVDAGATSVMVDLGGDIRFMGPALDGDYWIALVEDPHALDTTTADVRVTDGGVATSSRARRRWCHEGRSVHHLIDPRTGQPATSDLAAVTVVASVTWWAEVLAKAALIAGSDRGAALIADAGCSGLLIGLDATVVTVGAHIELLEQTRR